MGDKQKHSYSFQLSNVIHNLFFCQIPANRSLFKECVVKVDILILLNRINLLHARFQLEFGVLLTFLTGYFRHEPLVGLFVVDIHSTILFCDGDTWCTPPKDNICWNNLVSFNIIIHRTRTWRTFCTTGFLKPPPNQKILLHDTAYSSFETAYIFPPPSMSLHEKHSWGGHGGQQKLAELCHEFCRWDIHCVRNWRRRDNLNFVPVRGNLYVFTITIYVAISVIAQNFVWKHPNSFNNNWFRQSGGSITSLIICVAWFSSDTSITKVKCSW